jgi:hypothetical protein
MDSPRPVVAMENNGETRRPVKTGGRRQRLGSDQPGPEVRNKHDALLRGLIKCSACGRAMAHTFANKGHRLYRYYSCSAAQKQGRSACPTESLSAPEIESFVVDQIRSSPPPRCGTG